MFLSFITLHFTDIHSVFFFIFKRYFSQISLSLRHSTLSICRRHISPTHHLFTELKTLSSASHLIHFIGLLPGHTLSIIFSFTPSSNASCPATHEVLDPIGQPLPIGQHRISSAQRTQISF